METLGTTCETYQQWQANPVNSACSTCWAGGLQNGRYSTGTRSSPSVRARRSGVEGAADGPGPWRENEVEAKAQGQQKAEAAADIVEVERQYVEQLEEQKRHKRDFHPLEHAVRSRSWWRAVECSCPVAAVRSPPDEGSGQADNPWSILPGTLVRLRTGANPVSKS